MTVSNYDRYPVIAVPGCDGEAWAGWNAVAAELRRAIEGGAPGPAAPRVVLAIECSTGLLPEVREQLRRKLAPDLWVDTADAFLPAAAIDRVCAPWLGGDDPLFGFLAAPTIDAFLDPDRVRAIRSRVAASHGPVVVCGTGAVR
jgi:hypothetical protein